MEIGKGVYVEREGGTDSLREKEEGRERRGRVEDGGKDAGKRRES